MYNGKSSHAMNERMREDVRDAQKLEKDSHIIKHWFLDHPGLKEQPKFPFKIVGQNRDCLTRQIKEAVRL